MFQNSPYGSENEEAKDQGTQEGSGKVEHSRLTIPSNSKGYNSNKQRHSTSSISPLKSIPEATGNGASEIDATEKVDALEVSTSTASSEQPLKVPMKSIDSTPSSSMSLLAVTVPKGPSTRSASLQPPHEIEDDPDALLFNRRQSGELMFKMKRKLKMLYYSLCVE